MPAEDLMARLGAIATAVGPAMAPPGTARLLSALTETARQLFGARGCSIALLSDDEEELVYTTAAGDGAASIDGLRMPADHGVAGWVAQSGQAVSVTDLDRDARFARDVAEQVARETGYVPSAILAVPVTSAGHLLGVLSLLDRNPARAEAAHDMALLSLFADQAAIAIDGARAFADLGRVLLGAVAVAAQGDGDLVAALEATAAGAPAADRELAELAALMGELGHRDPEERALAVRITREVVAHTGRRR